MSDFIKSLIDEAHVDFLNRQYDESIRKLKSIKIRVNDASILGRMQSKENNIDTEYRTSDSMDDWYGVANHDSYEYWLRSFMPIFTPTGITTTDAFTAYQQVLDNVGANPNNRDSVDTRIINNVINGEGNYVNS